MSGEQRKRAAVAVVKVESRDDQVAPEAGPEFVETGYVQDLTKHALAYLAVGYPVHLRSAGTGRPPWFSRGGAAGRPVVLIHGDDEFASSDLRVATRPPQTETIDNYIHSVLKTEESMNVT
jgi:hypothetical protein